MSERDYPLGHPAAADYHGEKYTPPRAPWAADYDFDNPAHGGKNTNELDTPDGVRQAGNSRRQDMRELEAVGAFGAHEFHGVDTGGASEPHEAEALAYLAARNYPPDKARDIVRQFGVEAVLKDKADFTKR